ncbi:MAG: hypothetical protein WBG19_01645 [Thermoplasmata archaeon]
METKPSVRQQLKDHVIMWLLNNPEHAIRLDKARRKVAEWLR